MEEKLFCKGYTWGFFGKSGEMLTDAAEVSMRRLASNGLNWICIPRFGYLAAERRAFLSETAEGTVTDAQGRAQVDFPDLQMPRFETWHLPRGIGWQVGAALVAGYFLRTAARSLFIIQGAALVNFMQKARGTKRTWRVIVPILLMLFSVLVFLGIFDQISNIRGLRKPRDTKEDF